MLLARESPTKRLRLQSPTKKRRVAPSTPPPKGRILKNGKVKNVNPFNLPKDDDDDNPFDDSKREDAQYLDEEDPDDTDDGHHNKCDYSFA